MAEVNKDELLIQAMQDSRLLNAVEHILTPLLDKKAQDRIALACARFRAGEKDFIADIAYISAIQELNAELNQKKLKGNNAIKKLDEKSRANK